MILFILTRFVLALYLLSAAGFLVYAFRRNRKAAEIAGYLLTAGFAVQFVTLLVETIQLGQVPVLNLAGALEFFGWTLAGVYMIFNWKFRQPVLGAFALPIVLILVVLALIVPSGSEKVGDVFGSAWLTFHLAAVFTSYGFFALSFIAAVIYLLQEKQIKSKHTGAMYRMLPSLNVLDSINHFSLTIGFPLVTVGIITGMVLAQITLGHYWRWDPKEVWTLVLWLVYALLIHQRLTVGWRGRRAAIMAIVGFGVLCFTFIGVSFLLPGYHSFESLERLRVQ